VVSTVMRGLLTCVADWIVLVLVSSTDLPYLEFKLQCCLFSQQICIWSCDKDKGCDKENFSIWTPDILSTNSPGDKDIDSIQAWECKYCIFHVCSSSVADHRCL